MMNIMRVHIPCDIPVVGFEVTPYVLMRLPDNSNFTEDIPESSPVDGHFLKYKWYRIENDKKVNVCCVHPSEEATIQCVLCIKAKVPVARSYHCSSKCFCEAWKHHRALHARATSGVYDNTNVDEDAYGRLNTQGSNVSTTPLYPATTPQRNGDETWFEVGRSKTYTPTSDDIGHILRFECAVVNAETKTPVRSYGNTVLTSRVILAPSQIPRCLVPVNGADAMGHLSSLENFTVLSYNILADVRATSEAYSYCPSWALSWDYRRQNLLREIVGYHADIVCLQEVQSNHFEDFFSPELDKHGYQGLYKRKTNEVYNGNLNILVGCATFFRRDRFSFVQKYEVEYSKAAYTLANALAPNLQKKAALNRFVKDDVALILILEPKFSTNQLPNLPGNRQLISVANTHIDVHRDLKDVQLWEVYSLLNVLEKIAIRADIPMIVCGDFNSMPGSALHDFLAMGKVDLMHPELSVDPLGILRPYNRLSHQMLLVSAYSSLARLGVGRGLEQQRRKLNPSTNEPLFTTCTRDFTGTLDYIFYSANSLGVVSLLELLDEDCVRKHKALPSPEWSSDHIALLAEFQFMPRRVRRSY